MRRSTESHFHVFLRNFYVLGNGLKVSGMEHLSEDYKTHLTMREKNKENVIAFIFEGWKNP